MFDINDKFNLIIIAHDKNGAQLDLCERFPIDRRKDFSLPINTCFVSLFQYYETSSIQEGKSLFKIYIGSEMPTKDFFNKYLPSIFISPLAQRQNMDTKDIWEKRFCYTVDPLGKAKIISLLESQDRTVSDIEKLKQLIFETSLNFEIFEESVRNIKILGKKTD